MQIQVQRGTSLKNFSTYKVGGTAAYFSEAHTWQEMFHLREFARSQGVPFLMIGGGSNILIAEDHYPGLVIVNRMGKMEVKENKVLAEGGVNLMKLLLICAEHNLGGISGLANVPGSVGGAIYGNAGIPGIWIGDVLENVTILPDRGDKPVIVEPKYCQFGYRDSRLKKTKDIVLSATIKLQPAPKDQVRAEINKFIAERSAKQPAGNSCGSFFKNPGEFPSAGWLIEQAGCKGLRVGGAQVSPKHANFFMNVENATSTDLITLAQMVHTRVKAKFDVDMEPEVQIIPPHNFNKS